jgi:putative transposase
VGHHRISQCRACRLAKQHRSSQYYRSVKNPRHDLRQRMREIAQVRVRYGYRRIHVLQRREGWQLGRSQAYRLYREESLQLRSKLPRRRKMIVVRRERVRPSRPDHVWSLDFVADQLANGRRFRALTVVDVFTREALAIEVGVRLRGEDVVATLDHVLQQRGEPSYLFVDNGGEFSGRILDLWAYRITTRCGSTSVDRANQRTTATWKHSTDHYGTSVSTCTGSRRSTRPEISSRRGGATTMRAGLTWLSQRYHPLISPGG